MSVFTNCNVCGLPLRNNDEEEMGMCLPCAYGWQHDDECDCEACDERYGIDNDDDGRCDDGRWDE